MRNPNPPASRLEIITARVVHTLALLVPVAGIIHML